MSKNLKNLNFVENNKFDKKFSLEIVCVVVVSEYGECVSQVKIGFALKSYINLHNNKASL